MNYIEFVKGKYMKMALKGIKVPFTEEWESAMIATQCLFNINSTINNNAVKLMSNIPDSFQDKFEKGELIEYNTETHKYIEMLLRVQNYMSTITQISYTYIPPLINIILKNKSSIDIAIYKYFVGNKSVLENYASIAQEQVKAINNSFSDSFKDNLQDIERIKQELQETFAITQTDINNLINKISFALDLKIK
jgi:uncharacterized protein YejL (UPF0352 family)